MPAAEPTTGLIPTTARRAVPDLATDVPALPVDGLSGYVEAVARGLGLWPAGVHHEVTDTATAYIALAEHAPAEPGLDLMLTWSAGGGWTLATEPGRPAQAPVVLARLAGDVLPAPSVVAAFVARVLAGREPDDPPQPRPGALADRLTDYRRGRRSSADGSRGRLGRAGHGRQGTP
jgi:hypothetical protein